MRRHHQQPQAFTLAEMTIALGVATLIMAAIVLGGVAFLTVFNASDEYYKANADETRCLDYMAMDLRCALSGTISNSGQTLTLNLPDYLNYAGTVPVPRTPSLLSGTSVTYVSGATTATVPVVYSISGVSPNQTITRVYTTSSGTSSPTTTTSGTTTLTAFAEDYQLRFFNPADGTTITNAGIGGAGLRSVGVQISFRPKFNRYNFSSARTGATVSATLTLRN